MYRDDAVRAALRYRSHLPVGISAVLAAALGSAMTPLYFLALRSGAPSLLILPLLGAASVLVVNRCISRNVTLSADGRLTVTGLGRRVDVDVRHLTAVHVSAAARAGFAFAQVRWDGGGCRLWQAMERLPAPGSKRRARPSANVSEDFRDLVYRLHLLNPQMTIQGIDPPAQYRHFRP